MGIRQSKINAVIASAMLILGVISLFASAIIASSILAFIGLGLALWGALLLYITPSRHVSLELLNAAAETDLANIERILSDAHIIMTEIAPGQRIDAVTLPQIRRDLALHQTKAYTIKFPFGKGIYLPPKYLRDPDSSLVFVPSTQYEGMPSPEEIDEGKLYCGKIWLKGVFLTPPGLSLSKLIENEIGTSFTRKDLQYVQDSLPKFLIESLEMADRVDIKTESNPIMVEITNHVFNDICQQTRRLEKVHESVGCPMCSAMACALAKATGKPIVIEKEEKGEDEKTTRIQFRMLED